MRAGSAPIESTSSPRICSLKYNFRRILIHIRVIDGFRLDSGLPGSGVHPHLAPEEEERRILCKDFYKVRRSIHYICIHIKVRGVITKVKNRDK